MSLDGLNCSRSHVILSTTRTSSSAGLVRDWLSQWSYREMVWGEMLLDSVDVEYILRIVY